MKRKFITSAVTITSFFASASYAFADGTATESGQTATNSALPVAGSGDIVNGLLLSSSVIFVGIMLLYLSKRKATSKTI